MLADLLSRFDPKWASVSTAVVFDLLAEELPALAGLRWAEIPATGVPIVHASAEAAP